MSRVTVESFRKAQASKPLIASVPEAKEIHPEVAEVLWGLVFEGRGARSKEQIFLAALGLSVRLARVDRPGLPPDPPEHVIAAMVAAGARPGWAKDIYNAAVAALKEKPE